MVRLTPKGEPFPCVLREKPVPANRTQGGAQLRERGGTDLLRTDTA